ncbi:MAG: tRNA lysidine(34) synthetase TilS [Bacteroidetes bacterium]|nr:tRNA lysidine(34) synthetase TilS [Bacteroidota bacterium]
MIKKFEKYYQKNELFAKTDNILLTVSGGRDSVAMVNLFHQAKLNFGIAHCNFKLRRKEADKDEQFVKNLAEKLNVPFYTVSFNTKEFADANKLSTQMAARELRYFWFEEIRKKNNYQFIATAHHKNDVAETLLINLTKGTGLSGLHGIVNKKDKIIRPLLCFNRNEIDDFVDKNNLPFREDKSNEETKYVRNKIRHKIIPELEKINPSFIEIIFKETQQFAELEQLIETKISEERKKCFFVNAENIEIDILKLNKLNPIKTYLFYFLNPFGFNADDVSDVMNSLKKQSGKKFMSKTHQIIKDRNKLIISVLKDVEYKEFVVNKLEDFSSLPFHLTAKFVSKDSLKAIKKDKNFAYLNAAKINFPLRIKKWQKGDKFKPFGMKGIKKLSDFFIDEKLSLFEKENVWLLTLNNKIVWVVGYRIDDDFKLTEKTKQVLQLEIK